MPLTVSNTTGDGANYDYINVDVQLPDAGTSVLVSGQVQKVGNTRQTVSGSPVTGPAIPGSSFTGWIIQVNYLTGVASVKTAAGAIPTLDPSNMLIFTGKATVGDTSLAVGAVASATPDSW